MNNLALYMKQLEKEEQAKPKVLLWKEIYHKDQRKINEIQMKKTIAKFNETKSWFCGNKNNIDKLLARLIKKKGEYSNQ